MWQTLPPSLLKAILNFIEKPEGERGSIAAFLKQLRKQFGVTVSQATFVDIQIERESVSAYLRMSDMDAVGAALDRVKPSELAREISRLALAKCKVILSSAGIDAKEVGGAVQAAAAAMSLLQTADAVDPDSSGKPDWRGGYKQLFDVNAGNPGTPLKPSIRG